MAGRLVCQNCGLAAGSRAARSTPHSRRRSNAKRWLVILLGIPAAGRAKFDQCRLIDQVLNRLGNAMAINRLIIAEGKNSAAVAAASEALAQQNESYRRTKRQRAKAGCDGWQRD